MEFQNGPFWAKGVLINAEPKHFTEKKIIALAKVNGVYKKVALSSSAEVDNIHYFNYSPALDSDVLGTTQNTEPVVAEPRTEGAWVQDTAVVSDDMARFNELKATKAWLKPSLRGEYLELKAKLNG